MSTRFAGFRKPCGSSGIALALEDLVVLLQDLDRQLVLAEGRAHVRLAVHDEQRRLDVLDPRERVAARVDFLALCRRPAVARLREDLAEPIGIGQRIAEVVDSRHRHGGVVLVRIPRDRRHRHDAAVAVAVDADLAVHVRQRPHEIGGNRGIVRLTARPVVHAEILELAPETGAAAIVDGEDDVALRGQVLLDEVLRAEIGVGAAAVHVARAPDSGRRHACSAGDTGNPGCTARRTIDRRLPAARERPPTPRRTW